MLAGEQHIARDRALAPLGILGFDPEQLAEARELAWRVIDVRRPGVSGSACQAVRRSASAGSPRPCRASLRRPKRRSARASAAAAAACRRDFAAAEEPGPDRCRAPGQMHRAFPAQRIAERDRNCHSSPPPITDASTAVTGSRACSFSLRPSAIAAMNCAPQRRQRPAPSSILAYIGAGHRDDQRLGLDPRSVGEISRIVAPCCAIAMRAACRARSGRRARRDRFDQRAAAAFDQIALVALAQHARRAVPSTVGRLKISSSAEAMRRARRHIRCGGPSSSRLARPGGRAISRDCSVLR